MSTTVEVDLRLDYEPVYPRSRDLGIGCIGAGFIMRDIQLVAYANAGYRVVAIASRTAAHARAAAQLRGVPRAYDDWHELLADPEVRVLDIAYPPDQQLPIVREACRHRDHIRGILAQKPLAMNYPEAREIVRLCREAGIALGVNSNMRYDQSIRALRGLIAAGELGEPVVATIDMRAIPHWQSFLRDYDRLTILNMSIHHLDAFRFLFGDPDRVFASARPDPRTQFGHRDGIAMYILEYPDGFRAAAWDDVWAGPGAGAVPDIYIRWRVEGTRGWAQGTIGWPRYPVPTPSTLEFTSQRHPGVLLVPRWDRVWFPDAFEGTMAQLLRAVEDGTEPEISGEDHLRTMALVDACYRSLEQRRSVALAEIEGAP